MEIQEYPKVKYHQSGKQELVQSPEEEDALGVGWGNNPAGPFDMPPPDEREHERVAEPSVPRRR